MNQAKTAWLSDDESDLFDYRTISSRYHALKDARLSGNMDLLMMLMRENMVRNLGGLGNPGLFSHALSGTKRLVQVFSSFNPTPCPTPSLLCLIRLRPM